MTREFVISDFLEDMDQYCQEDLDIFDESHADTGACIGGGLVKYRKMMQEQSIDRHDKIQRFKLAISEMQKEFQLNQAELLECKSALVKMTYDMQKAALVKMSYDLQKAKSRM
jgi:hypothetical protein